MYIPRAFATNATDALSEMLELAPLVQVVSMTDEGLVASALPMILVERDGQLILQGHFARPNSHWKSLDGDADSLAIITGPDAYITPNSYASKAETHQVVPTWNYEAVHARGPLSIHDDADWVLDLVTRLTNIHEADQQLPWKVTDAPEEYIATRLRGIVGVEMTITSLEAKAKLSQDKPNADQQSAAADLANGNERDHQVATRMKAATNS